MMDYRSYLIKGDRMLLCYFKIMNQLLVEYFNISFSAFTEILAELF
jgi:hypothetical protein